MSVTTLERRPILGPGWREPEPLDTDPLGWAYYFSGRKPELQMFTGFLQDPVHTVLHINGQEGVGKSALLHAYMRACESKPVPFAVFDIRAHHALPHHRILRDLTHFHDDARTMETFRDDILDAAEADMLDITRAIEATERGEHVRRSAQFLLRRHTLTRQFIDLVTANPFKNPAVYFLDTFDDEFLSRDTRDWFLYDVLPAVSTRKGRLKVVIAGRDRLRFDRDVSRMVHIHNLSPLDQSESRELFAKQGLNEEEADEAFALTLGDPYRLALLAYTVQSQKARIDY